MIGVKSAAGYTIVEVMIFLSITGMLLIAAGTYISGQQERAYFTDAVRDAESLVEEIGNDVSTGFIPQKGEFNCTSGGINPPILDGTPGEPYKQGQNPGCIFLGKVLKFNKDRGDFTIMTVVGNRKNTSGQEAQNYDQALPIAVTPTPAEPVVDLNDNREFKNGLIVTRVVFNRGIQMPNGSYSLGPITDIGAFGIFSRLPSYQAGSANALVSGTQSVMVIPIESTTLDSSINQVNSSIANVRENDADKLQTILICFRHGQGGKKAAIAIGVGGRRLTTNTALQDVDTFTGLALNDPTNGVGVCP